MERKLRAILSADVEGYSRLMETDEEATIRTLKAYREVASRLIEEHSGRVVDSPGDNILAEFPSAVAAVNCAVAIQIEMLGRNASLPERRRMRYRIGVNLGDVITEGDRIYGDGVNVAARMEGLADGGGICVAGSVHDSVMENLQFAFEFSGERRVKNIARPVRVYHVRFGKGRSAPTTPETKVERRGVSLLMPATVVIVILMGILAVKFWRTDPQEAEIRAIPRSEENRKSIAVLPFENRSADEEDVAFFADGIHDDLLTALFKIRDLKVISRTSMIGYRNTTKKISEIAGELGVATVLEGGVQRAGNRVRINVQLIDAESDEQLWADSFDRELTVENLFAIQSEIARQITTALEAEFSPEEVARVAKKPTENLQAYDLYLQGMEFLKRPGWPEEYLERARELLTQAVELDPNFALAHARLSTVDGVYWATYEKIDERLEKVRLAAERALALDPDLPAGHFAMGWFYYDAYRDFERALAEFAKAEKGLPGSDELLWNQGWMYYQSGRSEEAIETWEKALILNPYDPQLTHSLAWLLYRHRRFDDAEYYIDKTLSLAPESSSAALVKGYIRYIREGQLRPLRSAVERYPELDRDRWWVEFLDRNYEAADEFLSRTDEETLQYLGDYLPKSLLMGITAQSAGERQRAAKAFASAREILEREIISRPKDASVHSALGFAYAGLNRKEDAVREGLLAVRLHPVSKDALGGPKFTLHLATIYTMVGQPAEAIAQLELYYSVPNGIPIELLNLDPHMDTLRDHPRFRALVEKYRWEGGEGDS